jgi:hypothetical protein
VSVDGGRETLLANLAKQRLGCDRSGSPFYARLLDHMIDDVGAGGPTWHILEPYAAAPFEPVYPLRLLGGLHHLVLAGDAPALARRYPSTGGDGDADAAWPDVRALLADPPVALVETFERAVQTNEVGRSVALVGGLLLLAERTGLPVRLLEVGASGGLNLRVDRYWYEQAGRGWGDAASPLRFVDRYEPGPPPFGAPLSIAERRGCDRDPIDASSEDGARTLLSYVWPGMTARFDALTYALAVARALPVEIDRADAADWVEQQLAVTRTGIVTVVWHSIVWQYLDASTRTRLLHALRAAAARATPDAPVAWLRLEPPDDTLGRPELRCSLWPGAADEVLAHAGFHHQPVHWLVASGSR